MSQRQTIEDQITQQIDVRELQELFSDDEPHDVTLLNAIFVDGKSVNLESFQPLVMHMQAQGYAEFDDALDKFTTAFLGGGISVGRDEMLVYRACGVAGLILADRIMRAMKAGGPSADDENAWNEAARVLGMALGTPVTKRENAFDLPDELKGIFQRFVDETKEPYLSGADL